MVHQTVIRQRKYIYRLACRLLDHVNTLSHCPSSLHRNRYLLITDRRVNMKCHISNFMVINCYLKSLLQDCFQCLSNLKFTVKKHFDILSQRITDLLISANSGNCKRDMVCKWEKNSSVYRISKHFLCLCQNLICNFQILRLDSLYQFFRRSTLRLLLQPIQGTLCRFIKTLADFLAKANTLAENDIFLIFFHINSYYTIVI